MPPTVILRITPEEINIEFPDTGQKQRYDNRVAYDPTRLTMLSYGKNEATLKSEMGKEWPVFRQKAAFTRILDPQAKGPILDFPVLEAILLKIRDELFQKRFLSQGYWPWNALDIQAEIKDYDQLSLGRRREVEYYLQDFQQARHLSVNGKDVTIPASRRYIQAAVGLALRALLPIVSLYAGLLALTRQWEQGPVPALGALALGIMGALVAYLLGTALYLLLFRAWLPHGYLRYQLRSSRAWLRFLTRWLSDRLLD